MQKNGGFYKYNEIFPPGISGYINPKSSFWNLFKFDEINKSIAKASQKVRFKVQIKLWLHLFNNERDYLTIIKTIDNKVYRIHFLLP